MPGNFLRLPEVKRITGKSKTAIYKEMKKGTFPTQVFNGEGTVAWLESEIKEWQENVINNSRNQKFVSEPSIIKSAAGLL